MLRLASGDADALACRRMPLADLERLDGAEQVIATLTDARLLTVSGGEVELSHEALLREWPRYRTWLEEDRVGRRLHAHVVSSAREWEATGRDPGDLYRGARLADALDWDAQHGDELSSPERRFLGASRRRAERNARRLRAVLAGVALLRASIEAVACLRAEHHEFGVLLVSSRFRLTTREAAAQLQLDGPAGAPRGMRDGCAPS